MKRIVLGALALTLITATAWAGSPHFVSLSVVRSDDTLTVVGKEAGLGNEPQVHVVVSATALCINPGGHHPKAENKQSVSAEGDFPVQNGKANFSLTLTATFQPECSPPMSVSFTDVVVCDQTSNVCQAFQGTF
jgi:hypothetical protein